MVSDEKGDAKVKIHQDANIYVSELDAQREIRFSIGSKREIYFVQIEGDSDVNGLHVSHGDAIKIQDEKSLHVRALSDSHFLFIEMKRE